jgi:hypothetical protein
MRQGHSIAVLALALVTVSACRFEIDSIGEQSCVEGSCPDAEVGPAGDGGLSPSCGNGVVDDPREECDDGADSPDTDACLHTCKFARCGDGFIRAGVESCDVGADPSCPATCQPCSGRVLGGHCYQNAAIDCNYDCSQHDCFAQGGHLLTVNDAEENEIPGLLLPANPEVWLWLASPTKFLTGETVGFSQWAAGEPSDVDAAVFGATLRDTDGTWRAIDRTGTARETVCELEGWFTSPLDNRAFRVEWQQLAFVQGAMACAAVGGVPAQIEAPAELEDLAQTLPDGLYHVIDASGCAILAVAGHVMQPVGPAPCTTTLARTLCEPAP